VEEAERSDTLSTPGPSPGPGPLDFGILAVLSVIWGSIFILYKGSLEVLTWPQVGLLRVFIAGLCLSPLAFVWFKRIPKGKYPAIAGVGILGSGIPPFLFALAQTRLDSGLTGVLNATTPVFALLLGMTMFKLKVPAVKVAGIFVGLVGAVVIVLSDGKGFGGDGLYGLFVLVATTCYGASINLIKSKLQDVPAVGITVFSLLFIGSLAAIALPFSGIVDTLAYTEGAWRATGMVALMAIFGTALSSIIYFMLIQRTGVLFSSSITYSIPVVAIAWGWLDGERFLPTHFGGMALILLAVWMISRSKAVTLPGKRPKIPLTSS